MIVYFHCMHVIVRASVKTQKGEIQCIKIEYCWFTFYFGTCIYSNLFIWSFTIIIMLRYQHGYLWPSLATPPYRPLLPAGLQSHIPYQHRATVCRFELVVPLLFVHVKGSTGVYRLWSVAIIQLYYLYIYYWVNWNTFSGNRNFISSLWIFSWFFLEKFLRSIFLKTSLCSLK